MVTQTWGCAEADAAAKTPPMTTIARSWNRVMSLPKDLPQESPGRTLPWSAAEWRPEISLGRLAKFTSSLHPRCAAIGARIMAAFEHSVRMQDNRARMPHGARIG